MKPQVQFGCRMAIPVPVGLRSIGGSPGQLFFLESFAPGQGLNVLMYKGTVLNRIWELVLMRLNK